MFIMTRGTDYELSLTLTGLIDLLLTRRIFVQTVNRLS